MKKNSEGSHIDFNNLSSENVDKMKKKVKIIAEYIEQQRGISQSIRETLESLTDELDADKESAKKAKKYVKTAARAYIAQSANNIVEDNTAIENLLKALGEIN